MHIAVIPAYEPDEELLKLLIELREDGFEIVVADDGSGDRYQLIFAKAKKYATVLTSPINYGKGHALKQAYEWIRDHYPKEAVIVVMDCDGQHLAKDAARLGREAFDHPGTLILGCRKRSKDMPLLCRFGNNVTRWAYRFSTHVNVHDTQTGLRAFSCDLLDRFLEIPGERYEYEMSVLLQAASQKIPIREIPVETIYIENNKSTHFRVLKDSLRIYEQILAFSASSLVSVLSDYGLYSLLILLGGADKAVAANVVSRIFSAIVNYNVNRTLVFKHEGSLVKSIMRYSVLSAGILACNCALLYGFTAFAGVNPILAKLAAEGMLLACSWLIQRDWIFTKDESSPARNERSSVSILSGEITAHRFLSEHA